MKAVPRRRTQGSTRRRDRSNNKKAKKRSEAIQGKLPGLYCLLRTPNHKKEPLTAARVLEPLMSPPAATHQQALSPRVCRRPKHDRSTRCHDAVDIRCERSTGSLSCGPHYQPSFLKVGAQQKVFVSLPLSRASASRASNSTRIISVPFDHSAAPCRLSRRLGFRRLRRGIICPRFARR